MSTEAARRANKRIAEAHGCVHCGRHDGIEPAHYPRRRSQGASWGLLEFLPLCHDWHYRLDNNLLDNFDLQILDGCGRLYYSRMLRAHPDEYLGQPERIAEVEDAT